MSSDFLRLEVEPKAVYESREAEARFYAAFFDGAALWVAGTPGLVEAALAHAKQFGLNALDSLHVAAAIAAGCDELVTTEAPTKPIFRVDLLSVVSIRPPTT